MQLKLIENHDIYVYNKIKIKLQNILTILKFSGKYTRNYNPTMNFEFYSKKKKLNTIIAIFKIQTYI